MSDYPIPTPNSRPFFLTVGPDGAVWFAESAQPGGIPGTNKVGRIGSSVGPIIEVPVQDGTGNSGGLYGIASGADGNLWITDTPAMRIVRLTTSGAATLFPAPFLLGGAFQIVNGADGTLWFTNLSSATIGRVTLSGVISSYALPENPPPENFIAADASGAVWIAGSLIGAIYRIDAAGVITTFPLPVNPNGFLGLRALQGITVGPDGAIWFTEAPDPVASSLPVIGRLAADGSVQFFPFGSHQSFPQGIASGPDGNLWFVDRTGNQVGRLTTAGMFTFLPIPTPSSQPYSIVRGADGNMWFTELGANKIGVVILVRASVADVPTLGFLGLLGLGLALAAAALVRLRS